MRNVILSLVVCILVLGMAKTAYTDVLTFDDFESGWGNYTDGGKDCKLYTGVTHAHQGTSAANIQDNSGTSSSFYHTNGIDVHTSGYTQITIDFWFKALNMDNGEDFMVQYYDGSTWHTVATYTQNVDFDNGVFYQKTVTIDEASYNFPTNMKIRFICDASDNRDDVYIDEISVEATGGTGPSAPTVVNSAATNVTETTARLNGQVTDTGGEDPTVIIYWGDNDGGTTAGNWDNSENMGTQAGTFFKDISGLTADTTYYFRCYASNSGGSDWADATDQFTTQAAVTAPTVVNNPATNVTETTARLNGQVTDTGGEDPTVIIYWGDNDGGTTAGNWDNSENMGTQAGTFFKDISGLTADTTYYFRCYASNSGGSDWADATDQFTTQAGTTTGTIMREYWTGIGGDAVTDLTSSPDYPDNPTATDYLTSFDAPIDWADNYGTRIRGYLHPPAGGDYTFWIASDDNSQLWLSTDDNPANITQIANVSGWTSYQQWDKYPEQQSTAISLTAGGKYYIEALQKEAGGGDHVSVAWQGPGITQQIIDGQYLSPWIDTPVVVNDGASSITTDSAVLNGIITDTGGEDPTVIIYWGDNDGGTNPGNWDNSENMGIQTGAFSKSISGLTEVTTYYFRCYCSNSGASDWADTTDQFTTKSSSAEIIPPSPDPMTWFSQPHAYVSYEVTMEATTASDASGVEYYFACTSGGGNDSGWQDSPVYTDTGLSANTTYAYKVRARDKSANQNETAYSVIKTVTTRDDSPVTGTDIDALWTEIELVPIMVNGDKDNRINVVFLNRWYIGQSNAYNNAGMRQEFIDDINNSLIAALTVGDPDAHTVYQHYSEFFNVYAAWWPNIPAWTNGSDDGTHTWALTKDIRDRIFLPWDDEFSGWATIIAMYNGGGGGGGAGLEACKRVGDCYIVGNAISAMLHELSHTFANVSDEYTTSQTAISEKPGYNVVVKYKRDELKWKDWIEPTTPIPTPYTSEYLNVLGCFEGNNYHLTDYFRLTAQNCIMGAGVFDNTDSLCPVCEQRVLMRTNKLVNAAADFSPANTQQTIDGTTQIHFSVNRIAPNPDTQQIKWILNGKTIATGVDAVDVDFGEIADYELVYSLTDVTSFVRENPPYGEYPRRQVRWTITNTNPTSGAGDLQVTLTSQNPKCESTVDGSIDANVSGGLPPYTYIWSTGDSGSSVTGLGEGIYEVTVVDSEFRSVTKTATLNWASTIDIDVRSTFLGPDQWQIDLNPGGTYTYQWSHGPTTPTVTVSDGTYGYTVTNAIGGTLNGSVTVTTPAELFNVTIDSFATDTALNTGKILLDASGGIAPYSFLWADTKQGYGTQKRHEAENAQISIPDSQIKDYYDAGGGAYLKLGSVSGDITWTVDVANAGLYKLDFVYATTTSSTLQMSLSVNGGYVQDVDFTKPPLLTGVDWDSVAVTVSLNAGTNTILLQTTATEAPHLDYLRAGQNVYPVPITLRDRAYLSSGAYTVIAKDDNMTAFEYPITITDETSFNISGVTITEDGPYTVSIVNPDGNYDYYWYAEDVPRFEYEQIGKPLHMGTTFSPYKAGNFYLASRLKSNYLESSNRIGFAISTDPKPGQIQENGGVYSIVNPMSGYEYYWYDQAEGGTPLASGTSFTPPQAGDYYVTQRRTSPFPPPVNPEVASSANLLLWLDATDMDGDGTPDTHPIGPYLDWTDRTGNYHLGQGAETFYKPAVLNGNGVSSWELVWIKFPPTSIQNYQTLMMVYKESSVSFTKSSPFVALNNLIGRHKDISVQMFDDSVSDLTKNGTTYVNSIQVDPFSTPMPTEFYLLTVEFSSTVGTSLNNTEGRWEGTAGEILLYDGLLNTSDREGVQEYLSQKWLSSAHLESERKQFTAN